MTIHERRSKLDSYKAVVEVIKKVIAQKKKVTFNSCKSAGYAGMQGTFNDQRTSAIFNGDVKIPVPRKTGPDWSLLRSKVDDTERPGSRPPKTSWNGTPWRGESRSAIGDKPKTKIPKTAKQMVAIERDLARWAREFRLKTASEQLKGPA